MHTETTLPVQGAPKLAWQAPEVKDLPRLTELTLQTGGAIPGDCGTSGSTCF
jgi:hypothetical protein